MANLPTMYVIFVDGDTSGSKYTGVSKRTTAKGAEYKIVGVLAEILRRTETKNWIAGRDAAADEIDCGCAYREQATASTKHSRYSVCQQSECLARLAADIRALTPPETQP
jgi:hypothetical protein